MRAALLAFSILLIASGCILYFGCDTDDDRPNYPAFDDDDDDGGGVTGDDDSGDDDDDREEAECQDAADELYDDCDGAEYLSWPDLKEDFMHVCTCNCDNVYMKCYMTGCVDDPLYDDCQDLICCSINCGFELEYHHNDYCYDWQP